MPNIVQNILYIEGKDAAALRIKEKVRSPERIFDFDNIIPIPRDCINPFDWAWENWGTKWNATNSKYYKEKKMFVFQTPWSAPLPVIQRLSKEFPRVSLHLYWASEDITNCGEAVFLRGTEDFSFYPSEDTLPAHDFYNECWKYDQLKAV